MLLQLSDLCGQIGTIARDVLSEAVEFSLVCGDALLQFTDGCLELFLLIVRNRLNLRHCAHEHFFIFSSHGFDVFLALELLTLELIGNIGALRVELRQNLRLCGLARVELRDGAASALLSLRDSFTRLGFYLFERARVCLSRRFNGHLMRLLQRANSIRRIVTPRRVRLKFFNLSLVSILQSHDSLFKVNLSVANRVVLSRADRNFARGNLTSELRYDGIFAPSLSGRALAHFGIIQHFQSASFSRRASHRARVLRQKVADFSVGFRTHLGNLRSELIARGRGILNRKRRSLCVLLCCRLSLFQLGGKLSSFSNDSGGVRGANGFQLIL